MNWIIFFLVTIVVLFIWCMVSVSYQEKQALNDMQQAIDSQIDFTETKVVVDKERNYYFAVDEERQEVFCYSLKKNSTL